MNSFNLQQHVLARLCETALGPVVIVAPHPSQWAEYRAIQMEAVKMEPTAFRNTPEKNQRLHERTKEEWCSMLEGKLPGTVAGKCIVRCALADGRFVGTARADILGNDHTEETALIRRVYVAAQYRRFGIGRCLVVDILNELRAIPRLKYANLTVYQRQIAAISLYRSLGFADVPGEYVHEGLCRYGTWIPRQGMRLKLHPEEADDGTE